MPVLAFFGSFLFCVPLITAFYAKSQGRNFWKWFGVGCILPIISVFILFAMHPEEQKES
jgi:energy-coupling factor transporter transmembrane protein EcfT